MVILLYIGNTPAKYIRQLKFKNIIAKYQSKKNINLDHIVIELGYYDNSHFYKEFKLFTGKTPKQFFGDSYPFISSLIAER